MSASLDSDAKANALDAGCCEYLTKPIQASSLNNTVGRIIDKKNG